MGHVWVTLDKSNKLSISTVNPEDTVSKNTTRVYIQKSQIGKLIMKV